MVLVLLLIARRICHNTILMALLTFSCLWMRRIGSVPLLLILSKKLKSKELPPGYARIITALPRQRNIILLVNSLQQNSRQYEPTSYNHAGPIPTLDRSTTDCKIVDLVQLQINGVTTLKNFARSIVAKLRSHVACELDSALSWKAEYQQGTTPFTVGASDETSSDFELLISATSSSRTWWRRLYITLLILYLCKLDNNKRLYMAQLMSPTKYLRTSYEVGSGYFQRNFWEFLH